MSFSALIPRRDLHLFVSRVDRARRIISPSWCGHPLISSSITMLRTLSRRIISIQWFAA